jgi:hypothetical protein
MVGLYISSLLDYAVSYFRLPYADDKAPLKSALAPGQRGLTQTIDPASSPMTPAPAKIDVNGSTEDPVSRSSPPRINSDMHVDATPSPSDANNVLPPTIKSEDDRDDAPKEETSEMADTEMAE